LGSEVEIEVEGPDEAVAMEALRALIDAKFGEGE
jgi:phosphocarrier protein HPr